MMRRLINAGFIWSGFLWSFFSYGQELGAPLGALPMQYNSSFAGEAGGPRFSSSFTLQPGFKSGTGHSYGLYTSYDQFIPAIRSGIGIMVGREGTLSSHSYSGYFNNNQTTKSNVKANSYLLSVSVAPKFSIQGKYTLSPSIDLTYMQGNILLISETQGPSFTNSSYSHFQSQYWQSRIGLLFNTNKYYVGYSIAVLYRGNLVVDDQQKTNSTIIVDASNSYSTSARFLSYLQAGYTFQRTSQSKFSFTPQVTVQIADNSSLPYRIEINRVVLAGVNLNFKYQHFIFGINNQGGHIGWQTDKIRLMLSNTYGSYRNTYGGYRGYVGNLSFRYLIKNTSGKSPNLALGNY